MTEFFNPNKPKNINNKPGNNRFAEKSTLYNFIDGTSTGKPIITVGEKIHKLPISQVFDKIVDAISSDNNFFVRTPTGTGKTTIINLLQLGFINFENQALIVQPTKNLANGYADSAETFSILGRSIPWSNTDPTLGYFPDEIFVNEAGEYVVPMLEKRDQNDEIEDSIVYEPDMEIPEGWEYVEHVLGKLENFKFRPITPEEAQVRQAKQAYDSEGNIVAYQFNDNTTIEDFRTLLPEHQVAVHTRDTNTIQYENGKILNSAIVVTDGMGLNKIANDPLLWSKNGIKVKEIIFDELDRGSLSQIALLQHVVWLQKNKIREKLGLEPIRIIVTSATADKTFIENYINCSTTIELDESERLNKVTERYLDKKETLSNDLIFAKIQEKLRNNEVLGGEGMAIFLPRISEVKSLLEYLQIKYNDINTDHKIELKPFYGKMDTEELNATRNFRADENTIVIYICTDAMARGITTKTMITGGIIVPEVIRSQLDYTTGINKIVTTRMPYSTLNQEIGRIGRSLDGSSLPPERKIFADILTTQDDNLPLQEANPLLQENIEMVILSTLISFKKIREKLVKIMKNHTFDGFEEAFDIKNYPFPVKIEENKINSIINKLIKFGVLDKELNPTELGIFLQQLNFPTEAGIMVYKAIQMRDAYRPKGYGYEAMVIGSIVSNSNTSIWREHSQEWENSMTKIFDVKVNSLVNEFAAIQDKDILNAKLKLKLEQKPMEVYAALLKIRYNKLQNELEKLEMSERNSENLKKFQEIKNKVDGLNLKIEALENKYLEDFFERRREMRSKGVEAGILTAELQRLKAVVEAVEFVNNEDNPDILNFQATNEELTADNDALKPEITNFYNDEIKQAKERIEQIPNQIKTITQDYPVSDFIVNLDILNYLQNLEKKERDAAIRFYGLNEKSIKNIVAACRESVVTLMEIRKSMKISHTYPHLVELLDGVENSINYHSPSGSVRTEELARISHQLQIPLISGFGDKIIIKKSNNNYKLISGNVEKAIVNGNVTAAKLRGQEGELMIAGDLTDIQSRAITTKLVHTLEINPQNLNDEFFKVETKIRDGYYEPETGKYKVISTIKFTPPLANAEIEVKTEVRYATDEEYDPNYAAQKLAIYLSGTDQRYNERQINLEPIEKNQKIANEINRISRLSNGLVKINTGQIMQNFYEKILVANKITSLAALREVINGGLDISMKSTDFLQQFVIDEVKACCPDKVVIEGVEIPVEYKGETARLILNEETLLHFLQYSKSSNFFKQTTLQ